MYGSLLVIYTDELDYKEVVANKFLVEIFPDDLENFLGGSFSAICQCRMEDTRCIYEEMQKYLFWGRL